MMSSETKVINTVLLSTEAVLENGIKSDFVQKSDTLNRYLLKTHAEDIDIDVLSFKAQEWLSKPYRYVIRFTSSEQNIPLEKLLNCYASFIMRAPLPKAFRSKVHEWEKMRQVNGTITAFSRVGSSADEAVYECILEHELALLDRTRKSAVYLDVTIPDLVKQVMLEHVTFSAYNINFDALRYRYPRRNMVIQFQETDLAFIQRLLSEVGIWYRFENHEKDPTEVCVVFGDSGSNYIFSEKNLPCVRNSGQTNEQEYVTDLQEFYTVVPDSVLTKNYNYLTPESPQAKKSINIQDVPDKIRTGREYHYADPHLSDGDFYGEVSESATFNARIRHEYLLNSERVLNAVTNAPGLTPGLVFQLTGNISDGFKRGFVISEIEISGARSEHFHATLKGIPYSEVYCYRPERQARPVMAGTVPARVTIRGTDKRYASTDAQGRYTVKFDFDLEEKKPGHESAFVRLGRPYAGDVYGFHFPLIDSTEVAVAFECGDPDRPFISHVMHDGAHADTVTMRNDTRNVIRTPAFNKIRLEDRRDQEHIKVSTEFGKSQFSAGHLVDASNKKRGEGIEVRTDQWSAIRASKGIMLTTEPQPRAQGQQLDMTAAIAALEGALSLAMTLQQCATTAGASAADTGLQAQLKKTLNQLTAPGLLAYADKGQAFVTPSSLQLSAGEDLITTAGNDASVSVVKKFSLAVGEKLSIFARKLGIQMIAGAGDVVTQAQRGGMHLLSQQDFTLASTDGKMNGSAKQGIQLTCGGGGIRINADGSVEIFSPTAIELKGPNLAFKGPESVKTTVPTFEKGEFKRRFKLHATDDPGQAIPNQKFRLQNDAGEIIEGVTDKDGHSSILDSLDLNTYRMELLS